MVQPEDAIEQQKSQISFLDKNGVPIPGIEVAYWSNRKIELTTLEDGVWKLPSERKVARGIAFAQGYLPVGFLLKLNRAEKLSLSLPYSGALQISLDQFHQGEPRMDFTYEVAPDIFGSLSNDGILKILPDKDLSLENICQRQDANNWLRGMFLQQFSPRDLQVQPLFAWPKSMRLNPIRQRVIEYLPEGMKVRWRTSPSTLIEKSWKSGDEMASYSFDDENGVTYALDANPGFGNTGTITITRQKTTNIALVQREACTIRGECSLPMGFGDSPNSIHGEALLRRIVRRPNGEIVGNLGYVKQDLRESGEFSFEGLLPGEYALYAKLVYEQKIFVFFWSGILGDGESRDLGTLYTASKNAIKIRLVPQDMFGNLLDPKDIWSADYPPQLLCYFRSAAPNFALGANGSFTVSPFSPVEVIGLPSGEWRFSCFDIGQRQKPVDESYKNLPVGSQVATVDFPRVKQVDFLIGVLHGTPLHLDRSGFPNDRHCQYNLIVVDSESGKLFEQQSIEVFPKDGGAKSMDLLVPQRALWIALYEFQGSLPHSSSTEGRFFQQFFTPLELASPSIKIQLWGEKGIRGTISNYSLLKDPPRGVGMKILGVDNQKFPKALEVYCLHDGNGGFSLRGIPQNANLAPMNEDEKIFVVSPGSILFECSPAVIANH